MGLQCLLISGLLIHNGILPFSKPKLSVAFREQERSYLLKLSIREGWSLS